MKIWLLKVIGVATLLLIVTLFIGLSYQTTLWIAVVLGLVIVGALFALYQSYVAQGKITEQIVTEEMIQEERSVEAAARTEAPRRVITRSSYLKTITDTSRNLVARISSLKKYAKMPTFTQPEAVKRVVRRQEPEIYTSTEELTELEETYTYESESVVEQRPPRPSLRDLIERGPVALQEEINAEEEIQHASENPDEVVDEVFREITQSIEEPVVEQNLQNEPVMDVEEVQIPIAKPVEKVIVHEPSEERVLFGRLTVKKAPVKEAVVEVLEDEQYPDLSDNEIEAFVIKPPKRRGKRGMLQKEEEFEVLPEVQEEISNDYEVLATQEIEPVSIIEPQRVFSPESADSVPISERAPLRTPTGILKKRIIRKSLPGQEEDSSPRVGYTKRYEVLD